MPLSMECVAAHPPAPRHAFVRPPGLASGATWQEAVANAAFGACAAAAASNLAEYDDACFPRIVADDRILDTDGRRYLHILRLARKDPVLHDLTDLFGIPLVAAGYEGRTIAYRAGATMTEATRQCLSVLVLNYQATADGISDYTPPPVPELPERLRRPPRAPSPQHAVGDVVTLARRLAVHGSELLVVPLECEPTVREAFPYVVRAVIEDA